MGNHKELLEICKEEFKDVVYNLEEFDSGGQKIVFKGTHNEYGDIVLKLIDIKSSEIMDRSLRELEIAANLQEDCFATVYEHDIRIFSSKKYICIVEEFIKGANLRKLLDEKERLSLKSTVEIGKGILKSLIPLHDKELVHRDIKPGNIILSEKGIVLLDFGIARDLGKDSLTADIQFWGPMTPGYAAPEQIMNQKKLICNRTDLFAWGIVMYECLEGYNPFKKDCQNDQDIIIKSCKYDPPKLCYSDEVFVDMVYNSLEKSVHRRPKSCQYILDILESGG